MTRSLIVIAGYLVLGISFLFQQPSAPRPVNVVPVTEAQIKESVKHERQTRLRAKRIKVAIAAARMVYRSVGCRDTYGDLTGRTAYEYGLSPKLLAAVVYVESGCRVTAVSGRNSVGLMQVNPKVWGHAKDLKDPARNLQIGTAILASYIRQFGLVEGLHHYNGYSEIHEHTYVNRVLAAGQIVVM
jgi:soluble lytic murein transglycosylase-like protein